MRYFFILGTNPTLSLAELTAIFNYGRLSIIQKNIAILEIDHNLEDKLIEKIGGVIKFGIINNEISSLATKDILKSVANFAKPEKVDSKFKFGISYYGKAKINIRALGMEFKKLLKQSGISSRWVISREPTLSSVVVEQNNLTTEKGVEIVIIKFDKKILLGRTIAVQPFKELSFRDYGRPARDDRSGMLPPKLAQIMINLSSTSLNGTILDPFCGSGTIITEAMLMGYDHIIGSDISNRAIADTKINIEWIKKNYSLRDVRYSLHVIDAIQISKQITPHSIDAIITEPYLGPQRGKIEIYRIKPELEKLYSNSLKEFNKILKPKGKIVMIWPVFQEKLPTFIYPNIAGYKIFNPIPTNLQKNIFLKLTNRNTIIYGREGQKVWREIIILEKNID